MASSAGPAASASPRGRPRPPPGGWLRARARWPRWLASRRAARSGRRDCGTSARERSPGGCSGMAARPYPWFWPGTAGRPWGETVMPGEVEQRAVIDDAALGSLADDGALHPVVEHLLRYPAQVGESREMTAKYRLQVLMQDEAR